MRTAIISIISSILTAVIVFIGMTTINNRKEEKLLKEHLNFTEKCIKKNLDNIYYDIQQKLSNFADVVASNKDFSFSLLVENNPSSPQVVQIAPFFIGPMNFSFLEIVDSSGTILSSGHFPASAGNSIKDKIFSLSEEVMLYNDNIKGESILTLQARKNFKIADFHFFVSGGIAFDKKLLKNLLPDESVIIILKHSNEYIATENVGSISSVKKDLIVINDKEYPAKEFSLPATGGDSASLIVVLK